MDLHFDWRWWLIRKISYCLGQSQRWYKKEFHSEPVYNEKLFKTEIKSYSDETADFYDKEIPKVGSNHTCLAVISLDSALKKDENYL